MSYENISPEEWEQSKIEAGKRKVITLEREEERLEAMIDVAKNLITLGCSDDLIAKATLLNIEQIQELRNEMKK